MPKTQKTILVAMPTSLAKKVEKAAKAEFTSQASIIRKALDKYAREVLG